MVNTKWLHDLNSGVCDITVAGLLDLKAAGQLRLTVLKVLAEQPVSVLVDLNAVQVADSMPLLILPALERRANDDCGIRLHCYLRADHPHREQIETALGRRVPLHFTRKEAHVASREASLGLRRFRRYFFAEEVPLPRRIVNDLCHEWGIEHLAEDAGIIVTELTNNAVQHAFGGFDLVLLLRGNLLHIQVIDPDPRVPIFPISSIAEDGLPEVDKLGGFGLYLVLGISTACGVAVRPPGKIVWATLRA